MITCVPESVFMFVHLMLGGRTLLDGGAKVIMKTLPQKEQKLIPRKES